MNGSLGSVYDAAEGRACLCQRRAPASAQVGGRSVSGSSQVGRRSMVPSILGWRTSALLPQLYALVRHEYRARATMT
jgi:hypothetical protein